MLLLSQGLWVIDVSANFFVGKYEMTSDPPNSGNIFNVIMHNVIWANQKTELFMFCWLPTHAMFDKTCFPAFVGASVVISSVLLIQLLCSSLQLLENMESKMKNTCVDGTIPRLFEGKMLVWLNTVCRYY